jgi:hypothetical protein
MKSLVGPCLVLLALSVSGLRMDDPSDVAGGYDDPPPPAKCAGLSGTVTCSAVPTSTAGCSTTLSSFKSCAEGDTSSATGGTSVPMCAGNLPAGCIEGTRTPPVAGCTGGPC